MLAHVNLTLVLCPFVKAWNLIVAVFEEKKFYFSFYLATKKIFQQFY